MVLFDPKALSINASPAVPAANMIPETSGVSGPNLRGVR
jgi:hypothetical protein